MERTMFEQALRARLPIITATTTDTVHLVEVVEHWAGDRSVEYIETFEDTSVTRLRSKRVVICEAIDADPEELYIAAEETTATILLVNPDSDDKALRVAFNAGDIATPPELVTQVLAHWLPESKVVECQALLHGLTLKEVKEVIALSCAFTKGITPKGINSARRLIGSSMPGIESIDTACPNYQPHKGLREWVTFEGQFLDADIPAMYRPRGLLFDGPPGTGKTLGAKYVAAKFGIPLFRLDLGHLMSKWQGESEINLRRALNRAEVESPAIVLLDEVEKVFKAGADADVTHRLLGYLLWWLQEHKAPLVTIMTTNDKESLPAELYRAGRVDKNIYFPALNPGQAQTFAKKMYKFHAQHWQEPGTPEACLEDLGELLSAGETHAAVDHAVVQWIKRINS